MCFPLIFQEYLMRRTTAPMCTTLTKETQIWMEWETCAITALWNIIPIRCVDTRAYVLPHFFPHHPATIIRIQPPVFLCSSVCISLSIERASVISSV